MDKVIAVIMSVIVIVITIIVAIQNCDFTTKVISLVVMLFIDGIMIGGCIYTFRK